MRFVVLFFFIFSTKFVFASELSVAKGKDLYEQKGANSCLYCHGVAGHDGYIKIAANLSEPKTWKVFKLLGGDVEFHKNPQDFLKKMEEKTTHLILNGAIKHNATVNKLLVEKNIAPYNPQMFGMTGAPSQAWLNKEKKNGMNEEQAAKNVYYYIQSFDTQNLFKHER